MKLVKFVLMTVVCAGVLALASCASKPEPVAPQQSAPSTYGYSK